MNSAWKVIVIALIAGLTALTANADSLPDLTVAAIGSPALAGTAETLTLADKLENIGSGDSGSWRYRVFLSGDSIITTNDVVLMTSPTLPPIPALTHWDFLDPVTIPGDTALGTNYFGIIVDFDGQVVEASETNNVLASGPVIIGIGPDLTVASVGSPALAGTAETLTLTNKLENIGGGDAGSWRYRVFLSGDSIITTNDVVLMTSPALAPIPGHTLLQFLDPVTIPAHMVLGTHYFGIIVDCDGQVTEANEANNARASAPVTIGIGPDLTVASIGSPALAGTAETLTLTNRLENIGGGDAGSWRYRVYLSRDSIITTNDVVLLTSPTLPPIPGHTLWDFLDPVTIPANTGLGTNFFGIIVDFDNQVTEASETNNARASAPATIGIGPDLTVASIGSPALADTNATLTLTNRLENIGGGDSGSWRYRVYLSLDANITTNDVLLMTSADLPPIPGHALWEFLDPITIPADTVPGTYYFGVIADCDSQVTEANEANNGLASGPVNIGITITIASIKLSSNTVTLAVSGLDDASSYAVQLTPALDPASAWTNAAGSISGVHSTNWSEVVPGAAPRRYYRIIQE